MAKKAFLGFRLNPELKRQLEEIAETEERSISQVCEMILRKGTEAYRKEGPKYLDRLISRQKKQDN